MKRAGQDAGQQPTSGWPGRWWGSAAPLLAPAALRGIAQRAGAVDAARAGAIAQPLAQALAFAHALALALTQPGTASRADAVVPIEAFRLTRRPLFGRAGRAAETSALTARAVAGGILGERGAGGQEAGHRDGGEDIDLHHCFFLLAVFVSVLNPARSVVPFHRQQTPRR